MGEWRDISTAPRDGTRFLAICVDGSMEVDFLNVKEQRPNAERFWREYGSPEYRYTHWMPLPAPPEAQ